jgi:NADH-quinone oxidoreductase subunit G
MVQAAPELGELDEVPVNKPAPRGEMPTLGTGDFAAAVTDFYLTNPVARASQLMGELAALAKDRDAQPIAAE